MTISSTFVFSLSGLNAAQDRLAVSANNTANVNTAGFKAQYATQADVKTGGTRINSIGSVIQPGPILRTGGALDLSIGGNGYFSVQDAAGRISFTRDGHFQIDGQGRVVDSNGNFLQPAMTVPAGATAVQVTSNGQVGAVRADGTVAPLGQIQLAGFANPGGLARSGDNLLSATANSGASVMNAPGSGGLGMLMPGTLEGSNVDLASEIVDQIVDLRAFQANIKPVKAADEMIGTLLDLKQ